MKLTLCVILFSIFGAIASDSYSQTAKLSLDLKNSTVREALGAIETQSEFFFLYSEKFIDVNRKVNVEAHGSTIEKILDRIFAGTNVSYAVKGRQIVLTTPEVNLFESSTTTRQQKTISGKVVDSQGVSLPGVSVVIKGTSTGTITNNDGNYTLSNVPAGAILQFSFVGMKTQETAADNKSVINVTLEEETIGIEEVVAVGYGTVKKINLSGAVESINAKELTSRSTNNVGLALQGLVPNLNITVLGGSPDATPNFNIRGMTSINGGEPLILVDGIRTSTSDFSRMNSLDIQNISVLKDASTAAIYGAQAAFGVILVTTKKGEGNIKVQFNNTYNVQKRAYLPEIVNDPYIQTTYKNIMGAPWYHLYDDAAVEYAKKLANDRSLPNTIVNPSNPNTYLYLASTDWIDETYKKLGTSRSHSINVSGSSPKVSYYIGAEYYSEKGMLRYNNDCYDKYNVRNRIEFKPTEWLLFGNNTSLTMYSYDRPSSSGYVDNYYSSNTLVPIMNPDGTYTRAGASIIGSLIDGGKIKESRSVVNTQFNAQIDLIKDQWSIKSDFTAKISNGKKNKHVYGNIPYKDNPSESSSLKYLGGAGNAERGNNKTDYLLFNIYSDFKKTWGTHHFSFLTGFTQEYEKWAESYLQRANLISNAYPTPQLASGEMNISENEYDWAIRGAFYRFNYMLKERYIFETNGRYDGTSRFPKENRFGFFPSFSAAWIISKESFLEPFQNWLSFAKIRVSYGSLGNQNVSPYAYIANMNAKVVNYLINGSKDLGIYPTSLISSKLTWEKIYNRNAGIDLIFFQNKLTTSFDIYQRDSKDMLAKGKTLPAVLGTVEPNVNAADLKTKGWELSVGWQDRISGTSKPFNYNVRFILSDSRAWITRFDNPTKYLQDYYKGQEIGEIWGLTTEGFFKDEADVKNHADQWDVTSWAGSRAIEPGDLKFKDLNNDGKINRGNRTADDPGDFKVIGNSNPRYNFGLDVNADWNNFDFRMFFQGIGKKDIYFYDNINFVGIYWAPWTNVLKHNLDHWTPENPNAYFPRLKSYLTAGDLGIPQTRYLHNGAFMRLKNLTFGYSLPKESVNSFGVENLRIYFSGENLFELSKVKRFNLDPEVYEGWAYPIQRTYSIGLNITL